MSRSLRSLLALLFVAVLVLSAVGLAFRLAGGWRADLTAQKLYTLSPGSKAVLARLDQPVTLKLYYSKTAAQKAPDLIREYNTYARYVEELLGEYVRASGGNVKIEVLDPRPFSPEEEDALRHRLQRHLITEEESFFFGLVVQTPFGVTKAIPFFMPDRRAFVEYDVSQLIDSAMRRGKQKIGVMSALPVMGEDTTGYMAQMKMMQGQTLQEPWLIVQQLRQRYEVKEVKADGTPVEPGDVDVLLVLHPKAFTDAALFAIDQYLLKGGKVVLCADPHAWVDQPDRMAGMMGPPPSPKSNPEPLLRAWGLEMPENTFAGDRALAITTALAPNQRPSLVIGFLGLSPLYECFNAESPVTANLNSVLVAMAGVLRRAEPAPAATNGAPAALDYTPLWRTSAKGNAWSVSSPYDLMMPDPSRWLKQFKEGSEPVTLAWMIRGKFRSAFPDGVTAVTGGEADESGAAAPPAATNTLTGLVEAEAPGVVAVFADVDFVSDMMAYRRTFFGASPQGDNAACLMNAVDSLAGSGDLIGLRSRGTFQRPFTKVESIEARAAKENEAELEKINAEIERLQAELNEMASKAKNLKDIIAGAEKLQETRNIELKIHEAGMRRRAVQLRKNEDIEALKTRLMWLNIASAPAVVLAVALAMALVRAGRRRAYVRQAAAREGND